MGAVHVVQTIPTFAVPKLQVGIDVYTRLGFVEDWRWPQAAPTHAGLVQGPGAIMLSECDPFERSQVYFIVNDVAACYESILAGAYWELAESAGAATAMEDCPPRAAMQPPPAPRDQPYGLRDFQVIDPWGHALSFGQDFGNPPVG